MALALVGAGGDVSRKTKLGQIVYSINQTSSLPPLVSLYTVGILEK